MGSIMKEILSNLCDHLTDSGLFFDKIYLFPKDGKLFAYGLMAKVTKATKKKEASTFKLGFAYAYINESIPAVKQTCSISTKDLVSMKNGGFFKSSNIKGKSLDFKIDGIENNSYLLKIVTDDSSVSMTYKLPLEEKKIESVGKMNAAVEWAIEWMPLTSATEKIKVLRKLSDLFWFDIESGFLVAKYEEGNVSGHHVIHPHPIKVNDDFSSDRKTLFLNLLVCSALNVTGIKTVFIEKECQALKIECKTDLINYEYCIAGLLNEKLVTQ